MNDEIKVLTKALEKACEIIDNAGGNFFYKDDYHMDKDDLVNALISWSRDILED